jgi:diguanylate cyclase (GGDEF)-like protein
LTTTRLLPLPWVILFTMLGATWLVWDHERQVTGRQLRSQFDFALRDTVSRIEQRVAAYEQLLRGVQALYATTSLAGRDALSRYVDTVQLDANFSGIQAIGVIQLVPAAQKSAHVAQMRRLGFAGYAIHPPGERDLYAPIIQREPYVGRNRAPLGFDPWFDPVRREAMERARDSGMAAITGKVQLGVDQANEASPGFVMYLPVYSQGHPREGVAQRREHLVGWVYASFHMSDFMASLYGKPVPGLAFAIYDGADPTPSALMYQAGDAAGEPLPAAGNGLSAREYMVVAGHSWTLALQARDRFEAHYGRDSSVLIAVAGVGLSLSMALLAWFMVTGRARALRLAARMTEELRHMAQHDQLTGLPNRVLFSDRFEQQLAQARRHGGRFALFFLDIDGFKPINDQYGHAVGDRLLQQVARRLQEALRASDTVGRIGGDEFVVLMPELAGQDAAAALADKIRQAVRRPFLVDGHELNISCSLGVAIYPDDGNDETSLTRSADEAMYRAKRSGRHNPGQDGA